MVSFLILVQHMSCVCLLFVNPECHICLHGRGKLISPTLIRDQPLQMNPNKSHCEGNLKPVWDQGERVTSTNTISIAVETGSAQEGPLSSHKKTRLLRRAKTNTPTLSTRHWGTDYEAVHKTNHVPRTDNNSETTLRTFKLWSPRRGFFVVFT